MLLAEKSTGHLVEISDIKVLYDPNEQEVTGSVHYGEEARTLSPSPSQSWPFLPASHYRFAGQIRITDKGPEGTSRRWFSCTVCQDPLCRSGKPDLT